MAFFKNVFGRPAKKERREFPNIIMNEDPELKWELCGELGDGAFGKVYKAKHKETGKIAAAKIVDLGSDEDLDDFAVEIDILVECAESEYVINLHEAYVFKSKLWMLIEFCAGGAMDDILLELNHGINEVQMKCVTLQMFEALAFMHDHNIIHRDLKAGNLLLCHDGMVKMADFGVSALNKSANQKRDSFIGTPFWMAPEVIACECNKEVPYNCKADIWSAGVTMIELADLNPPNYEMHPMRVLFKIPKADPPTVERPSKWSKEFNDFIAKCVVKDPDQRPSARDMLQHPFLQGDRSSQTMKVLFAEIRADFEDIICEIGEQDQQSMDGASTGDSLIPGSESHTGLQSTDSSLSIDSPLPAVRMGTPEPSDDKPKDKATNFKTLRRVRTYKVDGKEYKSTTEVIIDVNVGKSVDQQGERQMQAQRKLEVRARKILQREEVKETQILFAMIQRDKEEQEKRFELSRQELEKRYDNQLEALARSQKKDIEKFEKKQRDEFVSQIKSLRSVQIDDLKKFKKDSKNQEKTDEKLAYTDIEARYKGRSDRKAAQKVWKTEYGMETAGREKDHEQSLQRSFDDACEGFKQVGRIACRELETDFLGKRHELIQRREIEYWENEQHHFQDHYQLSKTQLMEAFRLQFHQMTERHRKEVEQHNRITAIKSDTVVRRHAIENKTVPQNLKKQRLAAIATIRKQLKKKSVTRQEEKETIKQCELDITRQQKAEVEKLHQRQKDQLEEVNTNADAALKELVALQDDKLLNVRGRETLKLDEHTSNFQNQVKEYNTRLDNRKAELSSEFGQQKEQLLNFYDVSNASGTEPVQDAGH